MLKRLALVLILVVSPMGTIAKATEGVPLEEVRELTDFTLLMPHYAMESWKLEIKEPHQIDDSKPIKLIELHYFDPSGQALMFEITQHKAVGYRSKRTETIIDVRNNTSTTSCRRRV